MMAPEFEARLLDWVRRSPEIEALIQIGSRAQANAQVDAWSDWDYHLVVRNMDSFRGVQWPAQIAPCWSAYHEVTARGVGKLSVVFENGHEVDFVPLLSWQLKLVYWAMAHPGLSFFFPDVLARGVANIQLVTEPGYRVLIGGQKWERRLAALHVPWPPKEFQDKDYNLHISGFWRHALWIFKKVARGENRAALRWYYVELSKHTWALLEEEARLAGRASRPEARKAEQWLDAKRVAQTAIDTGVEQSVLACALLCQIDLFEDVSRNIATGRGFTIPDHAALSAWLRQQLTPLANRD